MATPLLRQELDQVGILVTHAASHPTVHDRKARTRMFIYLPSTPIDHFNGLTPLREWSACGHPPARTAWALRALFGLAGAGRDIGWDGDMRHLPMVSARPAPPPVIPYLVVEQDNDGDTFIATDADMHHVDEYATLAAAAARSIGACVPTDPEPGPIIEPAF